jgi:hypothetical protein
MGLLCVGADICAQALRSTIYQTAIIEGGRVLVSFRSGNQHAGSAGTQQTNNAIDRGDKIAGF